MERKDVVIIRIGRRTLLAFAGLILAALVFLGFPGLLEAQKTQEEFKQKLDISDDMGGVSVATSADGKYVYVAGSDGILVSDDFGKTGTWVQTARLK